jgi:hypothetical protein
MMLLSGERGEEVCLYCYSLHVVKLNHCRKISNEQASCPLLNASLSVQLQQYLIHHCTHSQLEENHETARTSRGDASNDIMLLALQCSQLLQSLPGCGNVLALQGFFIRDVAWSLHESLQGVAVIGYPLPLHVWRKS